MPQPANFARAAVTCQENAVTPWLAALQALQTRWFTLAVQVLGAGLLGVFLVLLVHAAISQHSSCKYSYNLPFRWRTQLSSSQEAAESTAAMSAVAKSLNELSPRHTRTQHARRQAKLASLAEHDNQRASSSPPEPNLNRSRLHTHPEGERSGQLPETTPMDQQLREEGESYLDILTACNITADDPDACGKLLQIPKIAITFLTVGPLFHEPTWAAWFQRAAGVYPRAALYANCQDSGLGTAAHNVASINKPCTCDAQLARAVDHVCAARPDRPLLQQQHLFSVYIHRLPSTGDFPADSIFAGREIANRNPVQWGTHAEAEAAVNLLRAALLDPLNRKFILLSESGIPLYPPAAVHQQLMAEDLSRIDSCPRLTRDMNMRRYSPSMGEHIRINWRKSFQWVALSRKLADLIVNDTEITPIFHEFCYNGFDPEYKRERNCFSTEHLFPTIIAHLGLAHETDCIGKLVSADWRNKLYHPRSYVVENITPQLIASLRHRLGGAKRAEGCQAASQLISITEETYTHASLQSLPTTACDASNALRETFQEAFMSIAKQRVLDYKCPLFARKFPAETAEAIAELLTGCDPDVRVASSSDCSST